MKHAQFFALMSRMLGAEEKTIRMIVRYLREASLFTTGARGVNAPDITALDAARVFIAYMASQSPSKAVKDVLFFGALKPDIRASHTDFTSELGLNPNQPFERLIADILENKIGYTKLSYMGSIRLSESGDAWLECEYISQEFHHREQWMKMRDAIANRDTDEGKQRRLQGKTALGEMEAMQRSSSTKVQRSAEYDIEDLLEIGHELLGWEVE